MTACHAPMTLLYVIYVHIDRFANIFCDNRPTVAAKCRICGFVTSHVTYCMSLWYNLSFFIHIYIVYKVINFLFMYMYNVIKTFNM